MKQTDCLNEQDLTLHHYGELPDMESRARHVAGCPPCSERLDALRRDLALLPTLACEPVPATGTRIAARVGERLNRRRSNWLPALGASAVAAFALVATLVFWSPQPQPQRLPQRSTAALATIDIHEDMPDIDFLEDLDLLRDLELLRQLEGV